jgi:hypothetical protein
MIYLVTAVLAPPVCMVVFLNELTKCETVPQLLLLYLLEIAVCLLFLPSYKHHYRRPFFMGWLFSFCGVAVLSAVSGAWVWNMLGVALMLSVPVVPLLGLVLEPLVSKLKYHLLVRCLCVGVIVLIRFLL